MKKTEDIHFLKEGSGRVTGTAAYNRLLQLITRMSSTTIDIGRNNAGGLRLEVIDYIRGGASSSLVHSFQGTVSGSTMTVSAGRIHLPTGTLVASEATFSVGSTGYCYYVECTSSSAQIMRAQNFPNVLDDSGRKLRLPLLTASSAGIVYRHIGDYSFDWLPYFWIGGYSSSRPQVLGHSANGSPAWIDTEACE